jgi:cation-transporting ATPase E
VSGFKFAQRGVLAQQLNAVESLASVDVLCTDKTGTLTEPTLRVVELVPAGGVDERALASALGRYAASAPSRNLTLEAIADATSENVERRRVLGHVPFSSRLRWSALDLGDERLVLGAPERFVATDPKLRKRALAEASLGRRVLALGRTDAPLPAASLKPPFPDNVQALGLVVLAERLRGSAAETVAFFATEGVELKVLSGDAPATVGAIARDAGVPGSAPALDGEALPSQPVALRKAILSAPAVGRISPGGKRAVVEALRDGGATWRWSATACTTYRHSRRRAWPSPKGRVRRWHARSPTSCSYGTTLLSCRRWWPRAAISCATFSALHSCS